MNKPLLFILFLALTLRLFFFFDYHEVWWDSGAYIGMGKYLFSGGAVGLWEDIRPPLWLLVLGLFWKLGLDPETAGRWLVLLLSLTSIILLYKLTTKLLDKRTALIAATIFSFSPIFFYLGFHTYTEIPSLTLLLAAIYALVSKQSFLAGILLGLSTLTRFPMGLFIIPATIYNITESKNIRTLFNLCAGFALTLTPYLIINTITYNNPLHTIQAGSTAINNVLGCNLLRTQPWTAYLSWTILSEHPLHLFAILGIISTLLLPQRIPTKILLISTTLLPLAYYSSLTCRDHRYLLSFLPFITILTSYGINITATQLEKTAKKLKKIIFPTLLLFVLITYLWQGTNYYYGNENTTPDNTALGYFTFLANKPKSGEIWTANPIVTAYTNHKYNMIYYPAYHLTQHTTFYNYLTQNTERISTVLLDNCGGGIICEPNNTECQEQTNKTIEYLEKNYNLAYNKTSGRCWYKVYEKNLI